ncbi:MAG: peptide-methionine (S)-S-oxide reductase, partial [Planctomycetota bacterium]|nr:peptide-methionine (S)-S-oxide reductase [Planctomycetota bacterium]
RSVIFYHDAEQEAAAKASKDRLNTARFAGRIATEIAPAPRFHRAEEYHQQYLEKRGRASCNI